MDADRSKSKSTRSDSGSGQGSDPDLGSTQKIEDGTELTSPQRVAAVIIGALSAGGGVAAVFLSDNQAGTAALFVVAAVFLACGVFKLRPLSVAVGNTTVQLGRAAIAAVERLATDPNPDVRDKVVNAFSDELQSRGMVRPGRDTALSVISGYVRAGSENAQEVFNRLEAQGWAASSPLNSRYVLWTYSGPDSDRTVSMYQNLTFLAVSRGALREIVNELPGAATSTKKEEVRFSYDVGTDEALAAADRLRNYADQGV